MSIVKALALLMIITAVSGQFAVPTECFYSAPVVSNQKTFCPGTERRLLVGDFDGDSRSDLLCHDLTTHTYDILYNVQNMKQKQTTFCTDATSNLYTAELNGDERFDLVCQQSNGELKMIYANRDGEFNVTSNPEDISLKCHPNNSTLLLGDYNNDGISDIICHEHNGEGFHVLLSHQIVSSEAVKISTSFCSGNEKTILKGDFNNDGRMDLLCHRPTTSKIQVLLTNPESDNTNELEYEMNQCNSGGSFLTIADINGDGYDDVICKQSGLFGKTYILQNDKDKIFGLGVSYKFIFCLNGSNKNFYMGDFNKDGKYDLLCQTNIGTRQINISYCLRTPFQN